jgi:hypothetical protein
MLIGPGQKSSRAAPVQMLGQRPMDTTVRQASIRNVSLRRQSHPAVERRYLLGRAAHRSSSMPGSASLQFVSLVETEPDIMEVHTGKMDERIRPAKPGPESGSATGDVSDTKWAMDGLEQDRNAVVQGLSCLAVVPMGLWEQTVGVFQQHSREKEEQFSRALNAVTTQQRLEGALADEVARSLRSTVADPVVRTEEPMRFAFSRQLETGLSGVRQASASVKSKTALEIQVLSTRLVGKHRHSRSRAVLVEAQATIFRTSDGQELYSRPIRYLSSEKKLKDWAASDALLFRRELEACSRRTAEVLISDLIARGFVTPLVYSNSIR